MKIINNIALAVIVSFYALSAVSCGNEETRDTGREEAVPVEMTGRIDLQDAWARPAGEGGVSAVYFSLANGTPDEDTLLGLTSDVSDHAELHESYEKEDGTMGMRPAENVVIEPGQRLILKPGGFHVMLMDLEKELAVGDSLRLKLEFSQNGPVEKWVSISRDL